jgi:hypothetical protein
VAVEHTHIIQYSPSNLVAKALAWNNRKLLDKLSKAWWLRTSQSKPRQLSYALVGIEIQRQSSVVLLDDDASSLLDSLSANATHDEGSAVIE